MGAGLVGLGSILSCSLPLPLDRRGVGVSGLARLASLGSVVGCAVRVDLGLDSASGLSAGLLPG